MEVTAGAYADQLVADVRDEPGARLTLLRSLYRTPASVGRNYLPYRRAASAFMEWQLRRGLLNPDSDSAPGSPWWRAVNDSLLLDTCEASALALGRPGEPRSASVAATLAFIRAPTAQSWYRAHNLTIASAYLSHEDLALHEGRVERFFINLILVRVMYAHALVAEPKLALGWLAPCGWFLGDPRLGMTGIFLSLSRVLPDRYPLGDNVSRHIDAEHSLGRLLDIGMILPRLTRLYGWSAHVLDLPGVENLLDPAGLPCYAWQPDDVAVWRPTPSRLARLAQAVVPA